MARFGDNMREVAVTEGNKVSAQIQFGYSVSGYGVGDLVAIVNSVLAIYYLQIFFKFSYCLFSIFFCVINIYVYTMDIKCIPDNI